MFVVDQMLTHILQCLRMHPTNHVGFCRIESACHDPKDLRSPLVLTSQPLCTKVLALLDNLSSAQASKSVMLQLDTAR